MSQKHNEIYNFDDIENQLKTLPEKNLPENFHSRMMSKLYQGKEVKKMNWDKILAWLRPRNVGFVLAGVLVIAIALEMGSSVGNYNTSDYATNQVAPGESWVKPMVSGGMSNSYSRDEEMYKSARSVAYDTAAAAPEMENGFAEKQNFTGINTTTQTTSAVNDLKIIKTAAVNDLKIIKTARISIEVLDFDGVFDTVRNIALSSGGYVQDSSSYIYDSNPSKKEYLKKGFMTIRVPKEKYDEVRNTVGNIGKVINSSENTENVTAQYIETESKVKMLEIEQERIFDIMKKATKVEDLIKLEDRLSQIRMQLEYNKSQIANWDKLVSLSTINVELTQVRNVEVIQPVDKNLSQRISESFVKSVNNIKTKLEDTMVWFAGNFITLTFKLIVLIIGVAIVAIVIKKIAKKYRKK